MSHGNDGYVRIVSGYEVMIHHPGGIRTWFHPNRETQLARLTAVMATVPDALVIHDIETDSPMGLLVRQIKIEASRDPVQDSLRDRAWDEVARAGDVPEKPPVAARPTDDHWGKAVDAYEELGKAFDTGAFAPPEGAAAWKLRAAKAITEIAMYLGLRERLERDHAETTAGDKP